MNGEEKQDQQINQDQQEDAVNDNIELTQDAQEEQGSLEEVATSKASENKIILVVFAVVIIVLALMYIWGTNVANSPDVDEPNLPPLHDEVDVNEEIKAIEQVNISDEIDLIQEDLMTTELENLDKDLESMEAELDVALEE